MADPFTGAGFSIFYLPGGEVARAGTVSGDAPLDAGDVRVTCCESCSTRLRNREPGSRRQAGVRYAPRQEVLRGSVALEPAGDDGLNLVEGWQESVEGYEAGAESEERHVRPVDFDGRRAREEHGLDRNDLVPIAALCMVEVVPLGNVFFLVGDDGDVPERRVRLAAKDDEHVAGQAEAGVEGRRETTERRLRCVKMQDRRARGGARARRRRSPNTQP